MLPTGLNMKKIKYRTINVAVDDYNMIKQYCNNNTLVMSKWIPKVIKEYINEQQKQ